MDIRNLIEELIEEHQNYIQKMKDFEKRLESDFSEEVLEDILKFLETDIQEHAQKEEENLNEEVEGKFPDFDSQAIKFAHDVIDEAIEDLKWEISLNDKKNHDKVIKQIKKIFSMIKDHFLEEENFLFPNVYKEKKEWI